MLIDDSQRLPRSDLEMELWKAEWYSPLYVEKYLLKESKIASPDHFDTETKYQKAREIRLGRALALCLYDLTSDCCFVTLPKNEPPDLCILAKNFKKNLPPMIYKVEITTYIGSPSKGLLEHLQDSEKITGKHQFNETDIVLVNIGIGLQPDYEPLIKHLYSIKAPYSIWAMQDASRNGTTFSLFTIIYPRFQQIEVNLGLAATRFQSECQIERLQLNRTGESLSGTITKTEKVKESIPWIKEV